MATVESRPLEAARVEALLGRVTADFGAALGFPLVIVGEQLGLFTAVADGPTVSAKDHADRTDTTRDRPSALLRICRRP